MTRELAVIKEVSFGVHDIGRAELRISVELLCGVSIIWLPLSKAVEMIEKNYISDIKELKGRPCIVEINDNNDLITFVGLKEL